MTPVILESPYSGDVPRNIRYARLCLRDCILNYTEAPYASHLLYTQALDDTFPEERTLGIQAGFQWSAVTWEEQPLRRVFYVDFGWSRGMLLGKQDAIERGQEVVERTLPSELLVLVDSPEAFVPREWVTPG